MTLTLETVCDSGLKIVYKNRSNVFLSKQRGTYLENFSVQEFFMVRYSGLEQAIKFMPESLIM